jgi:hypothetical protein
MIEDDPPSYVQGGFDGLVCVFMTPFDVSTMSIPY